MVAVVQLVEHQVVILAVAGSSPVSHPQVGGHFLPSHLLRFAPVPVLPVLGSIDTDDDIPAGLFGPVHRHIGPGSDRGGRLAG